MNEKKILVVEDESGIRKLYQQAFKKAGYLVEEAESAERALEVIFNKNFDVMILDLNLPMMNGMELCRQIKQNRPMSIVFAATGYASLFELSECRESGFDDYFIKPVDMKKLIKAVETAFETVARWRKKSS